MREVCRWDECVRGSFGCRRLVIWTIDQRGESSLAVHLLAQRVRNMIAMIRAPVPIGQSTNIFNVLETREQNPRESMQMAHRDLEEEELIIYPSYPTPPLDTNSLENKPLEGAVSFLSHGCKFKLLSGNSVTATP